MRNEPIGTARPEHGFRDKDVIFFYLTGVGFEVKERKAKYDKKKKKKTS